MPRAPRAKTTDDNAEGRTPPSIRFEPAVGPNPETPMAVRSRKALNLPDPIRVGIVIHHVLRCAAGLRRSAQGRQGVDEDRRALGRVGTIGKAAAAFSREVDLESGVIEPAEAGHERRLV